MPRSVEQFSSLLAALLLPGLALAPLGLALPVEPPEVEQVLHVVADVVRVLHRDLVAQVHRLGAACAALQISSPIEYRGKVQYVHIGYMVKAAVGHLWVGPVLHHLLSILYYI